VRIFQLQLAQSRQKPRLLFPFLQGVQYLPYSPRFAPTVLPARAGMDVVDALTQIIFSGSPHAVIGRDAARAEPVDKGENSLWIDCRKPGGAAVEKAGIECV
jgi:hypothetical protein